MAQWYGVRAANLLFRIKNEAVTAFNTYCPDSIKNAMLAHPATDTWWNARHVTREEIIAFRNLLTRSAVKTIQNDQIVTDVAGYLDVAARWGLNKDTETAAVAFFCTVYHQSPNAASQIVANLPSPTNLDTIYQATLNNDIVGDYVTRQTTAYNIIKNGDVSGVENPTDDTEVIDDGTSEDGTDGTGGGRYRRGKNHHIIKRGNQLILYRTDGSTLTFYKSGGAYLPRKHGGTVYTNPNNPTNPDENTDNPPTPVDPNTPKGTGADIIAFARTKLLDFDYSQAPGRMTPEVSGYTDCSAFIIYAYQKGGNVGLNATYTGNLCTLGTLVKEGRPTTAEMQAGDMIFLRWGSAVRANSPFDHVELYTGDGQMISMGRTPGPHQAAWDQDINYALGNGGRVQVRRYL